MDSKSTTEKTYLNLPVEVLAHIFNFLPNQDIRCGVSLVCKQFYEISRNESLVPVKDLWINGRKLKKKGNQGCSLKNIGAVSDIIAQSKHLTLLQIKALNWPTVNKLLRKACINCPKLIHLEIAELKIIEKKNLKKIFKMFKNLKELTIINCKIDVYEEYEVEEILPNCNVEIKECRFVQACEDCGLRRSDFVSLNDCDCNNSD